MQGGWLMSRTASWSSKCNQEERREQEQETYQQWRRLFAHVHTIVPSDGVIIREFMVSRSKQPSLVGKEEQI